MWTHEDDHAREMRFETEWDTNWEKLDFLEQEFSEYKWRKMVGANYENHLAYWYSSPERNFSL